MAWWRRDKAEAKERAVPKQHSLDLRIEELEHRQEHLEAMFRRLRGYVYVRKGMVGPPGTAPEGETDLDPQPQPPQAPAAPAPSESRDALRAKLVRDGTFVPGRPAIHK